jgi:hypothetical protein
LCGPCTDSRQRRKCCGSIFHGIVKNEFSVDDNTREGVQRADASSRDSQAIEICDGEFCRSWKQMSETVFRLRTRDWLTNSGD